MAERKERLPDTLQALQIDVERIWKTLELNRETIKMFDEPVPWGETKSTDTCSCSCTDQASPVAGCIMTVYH